MKRQLKIVINKGRIVDGNVKVKDIITSSEDGEYIFTIESIKKDKTLRDYQEEYFAKLDSACSTTGYQKYELHEMFKNHCAIESTKAFTVIDWIKYLKDFSWWCFSNFELII